MYVRNVESKLCFEGLPVRWSFQSSSVNLKTGPDVSFANSNGYVIGESLLSLSVTIFFTHLSPGWSEIKLRMCVCGKLQTWPLRCLHVTTVRTLCTVFVSLSPPCPQVCYLWVCLSRRDGAGGVKKKKRELESEKADALVRNTVWWPASTICLQLLVFVWDIQYVCVCAGWVSGACVRGRKRRYTYIFYILYNFSLFNKVFF